MSHSAGDKANLNISPQSQTYDFLELIYLDFYFELFIRKKFRSIKIHKVSVFVKYNA